MFPAVAASRVIWYLARDPAMARRLLACEAADALTSGLESGVSDPLPSIGACCGTVQGLMIKHVFLLMCNVSEFKSALDTKWVHSALNSCCKP